MGVCVCCVHVWDSCICVWCVQKGGRVQGSGCFGVRAERRRMRRHMGAAGQGPGPRRQPTRTAHLPRPRHASSPRAAGLRAQRHHLLLPHLRLREGGRVEAGAAAVRGDARRGVHPQRDLIQLPHHRLRPGCVRWGSAGLGLGWTGGVGGRRRCQCEHSAASAASGRLHQHGRPARPPTHTPPRVPLPVLAVPQARSGRRRPRYLSRCSARAAAPTWSPSPP